MSGFVDKLSRNRLLTGSFILAGIIALAAGLSRISSDNDATRSAGNASLVDDDGRRSALLDGTSGATKTTSAMSENVTEMGGRIPVEIHQPPSHRESRNDNSIETPSSPNRTTFIGSSGEKKTSQMLQELLPNMDIQAAMERINEQLIHKLDQENIEKRLVVAAGFTSEQGLDAEEQAEAVEAITTLHAKSAEHLAAKQNNPAELQFKDFKQMEKYLQGLAPNEQAALMEGIDDIPYGLIGQYASEQGQFMNMPGQVAGQQP